MWWRRRESNPRQPIPATLRNPWKTRAPAMVRSRPVPACTHPALARLPGGGGSTHGRLGDAPREGSGAARYGATSLPRGGRRGRTRKGGGICDACDATVASADPATGHTTHMRRRVGRMRRNPSSERAHIGSIRRDGTLQPLGLRCRCVRPLRFGANRRDLPSPHRMISRLVSTMLDGDHVMLRRAGI